ncbi:TonB family protein [Nitrospirota bacterium]
MRGEFSLEKAASISFAIHIVFFIIAGFATTHRPSLEESVYAVRLISPEPANIQSGNKGEGGEGSEKEQVRARRVPPPKSTSNDVISYDADAIEAKSKAIQKARQHRTKRIKELREQKEASEYADKQLEEMQRQSKLDAIRRDAQKKAGSLGEQRLTGKQKSDRLAEYTALVRDRIRKNWGFTETESNGRLLVEVLVNIRSTGIIDIVKIARPSGNRPFDRSVIKAIKKTGEVDPPPFGENLTGVTLGFTPEDM